MTRTQTGLDPLVKTKGDGTPYQRRADIDSTLTSLVNLSRNEILARLRIKDRAAPAFIQSECLVHLIRRSRNDNDDRYLGELMKELVRRVMAVLPAAHGNRMDLKRMTVSDQVLDVLLVKFAEDRQSPGTWLDYFEVMFAGAVAALRRTAMKSARRQERRFKQIEHDEESGELPIEIEKAVGSLDIEEALLSDDPVYRSSVAAAIRSLPEQQKVVLELLRQGFPIDSKDEDVQTIVKMTGAAEKTVRNRRDAAIRAIRAQLGIGEDQ